MNATTQNATRQTKCVIQKNDSLIMNDLLDRYTDLILTNLPLWEEMLRDFDEEEHQEMTDIQKKDAERRRLYILGLYELEEGEVL